MQIGILRRGALGRPAAVSVTVLSPLVQVRTGYIQYNKL